MTFVKLRLKALRSLRWNYKRRGVWIWLKGRAVRRCVLCAGTGEFALARLLGPAEPKRCFWCDGSGKEFGKRGYQRILSEPEKVIADQTRLAEGVFA